jgi:hypothetical protein
VFVGVGVGAGQVAWSLLVVPLQQLVDLFSLTLRRLHPNEVEDEDEDGDESELCGPVDDDS